MQRSWPTWLLRAASVSVGTLTALLGTEIALRIIDPAVLQDRLLGWSSSHFRTDGRGAVRYRPNERVREIAVYGRRVAYDVDYVTNDAGFVDHRDYGDLKAHPHVVAFVGDSFTAGVHAGEPWVPRLRDRVRASRDIEILNLGVAGTGVEHFEALLDSVGSELGFQAIVILALSDDFLRPRWYPLTDAREIRFCQPGEDDASCRGRAPVARVFDYSAPDHQVVETLRRLEQAASAGGKWSPRLLRLFRTLRDSRRRSGELSDPLLQENMAALGRIRTRFPDKPIHLIHLPSRQETGSGAYDLSLADQVTAIGIRYHPALLFCPVSEDWYQSTDPHPNTLGYAGIEACVAEYLGL